MPNKYSTQTYLEYPQEYVDVLTEGSSFCRKNLSEAKTKIDLLLKDRRFDDKLQVIPEYMHTLITKGKTIQKDILLSDVIGHMHGSYSDCHTWSSVFVHLKRLSGKMDMLSDPSIIQEQYLSKDGDIHTILFYEHEGKYFVGEGMHRTVIAKFGQVKEFRNVPVCSIAFDVPLDITAFLAAQNCYITKCFDSFSLTEKLSDDYPRREDKFAHFASKEELNSFIDELQSQIVPNNLSVKQYMNDKLLKQIESEKSFADRFMTRIFSK